MNAGYKKLYFRVHKSDLFIFVKISKENCNVINQDCLSALKKPDSAVKSICINEDLHELIPG